MHACLRVLYRSTKMCLNRQHHSKNCKCSAYICTQNCGVKHCIRNLNLLVLAESHTEQENCKVCSTKVQYLPLDNRCRTVDDLASNKLALHAHQCNASLTSVIAVMCCKISQICASLFYSTRNILCQTA
jgi:hypothetical protein